jgi:triosephosphate isomerase
VGETLEQRSEGRVESVILAQLDAALEGLSDAASAGHSADFLLAYEPVWAIGTGETATPDDAAGAHGALRGRLGEVYGGERAVGTPILYGGSVKPGNAAELLAAGDVDGLLVGGASLEAGSFADIVAAAL